MVYFTDYKKNILFILLTPIFSCGLSFAASEPTSYRPLKAIILLANGLEENTIETQSGGAVTQNFQNAIRQSIAPIIVNGPIVYNSLDFFKNMSQSLFDNWIVFKHKNADLYMFILKRYVQVLQDKWQKQIDSDNLQFDDPSITVKELQLGFAIDHADTFEPIFSLNDLAMKVQVIWGQFDQGCRAILAEESKTKINTVAEFKQVLSSNVDKVSELVKNLGIRSNLPIQDVYKKLWLDENHEEFWSCRFSNHKTYKSSALMQLMGRLSCLFKKLEAQPILECFTHYWYARGRGGYMRPANPLLGTYIMYIHGHGFSPSDDGLRGGTQPDTANIAGLSWQQFSKFLDAACWMSGHIHYKTCYGGGFNFSLIKNYVIDLYNKELVHPLFSFSSGALTDAEVDGFGKFNVFFNCAQQWIMRKSLNELISAVQSVGRGQSYFDSVESVPLLCIPSLSLWKSGQPLNTGPVMNLDLISENDLAEQNGVIVISEAIEAVVFEKREIKGKLMIKGGTYNNLPAFVSLQGGNARHEFEAIDLMNSTFSEFLRKCLSKVNNLYTKLYCFHQLSCKNDCKKRDTQGSYKDFDAFGTNFESAGPVYVLTKRSIDPFYRLTGINSTVLCRLKNGSGGLAGYKSTCQAYDWQPLTEEEFKSEVAVFENFE